MSSPALVTSEGSGSSCTASTSTRPPADAPLSPVILTLIRHGETTANLARLLQGVADSPFTVFGQAQVDALAKSFATTLTPKVDSSIAAKTGGPSRLDLPPPTLIVCSPVGRARKTAEAVYKACGGAETAETLEASASGSTRTAKLLDSHHSGQGRTNGLRLVVDPGLAERDFGPLESTRNRQHVSGFERGKGKGEDKGSFKARVQREGNERLQHVVLVSHGMWIASFLSLHPPTTIRRFPGQPDFLPFAHNTGIFSLEVEAATQPAAGSGDSMKIRTNLVKANDVTHLVNVRRQRGGIGRVAYNDKQTKLQGFFVASPPKKRKADGIDDVNCGDGEVAVSLAGEAKRQDRGGGGGGGGGGGSGAHLA